MSIYMVFFKQNDDTRVDGENTIVLIVVDRLSVASWNNTQNQG